MSIETRTDNGEAPDHGARIDRFLRSARRRFLLRSALWCLIWAAVLDKTWLWGSTFSNVFMGIKLPVYSLGFFLFPVLLTLQALRLKRTEVAVRVDRRLELKDRLVSFLDFSGRSDIAREFREAQAAETAQKIKDVRPRQVIRIHPLLWGAPLVFLTVFSTHFFPADIYMGPNTRRFSGNLPGGRLPSSLPGSAERAGNQPVDKPGGEKNTPAEQVRGPEKKDELKKDREAPADRPSFAAPYAGGTGVGRAKKPDDRPWRMEEEPTQLFSETLGKKLTPTVQGASLSPPLDPSVKHPPLPRGRQAFNLIPRLAQGKDGIGEIDADGGGKPGGTLEIIVDFDSIPAEYREYVRRYFMRLNTGEQRETEG